MVRWTIGIERQCGQVNYRHGEACSWVRWTIGMERQCGKVNYRLQKLGTRLVVQKARKQGTVCYSEVW